MSTPRRLPPRSIGTPTISICISGLVRSRSGALRPRLRLEDRLDRPLRRELVADECLHGHAREAAAHLLHRGLEAAGIAGPHDPLEAHLVDAREEAEPVAVV